MQVLGLVLLLVNVFGWCAFSVGLWKVIDRPVRTVLNFLVGVVWLISLVWLAIVLTGAGNRV